MKNIWWLNHHAVPPVVPGGTRHYSLAKELLKFSYKVIIINGSFDHLTSHFVEGSGFGASLQEPLVRTYEGVDFYSLPTPPYTGNTSLGRIKNMYAFYRNAIKYLASNPDIEKPDIIIGSTVHPLAALAGYKLSKIYKVPFVYEVRDLWPQTLVDLGKISQYHPIVILFNYLDSLLSKEAFFIITTAPLMKNYYIRKYNIPENKFLWITNGTAFIEKEVVPTRVIENNDVIEVGYTGALGYANGIMSFLQELLNVPLHIRKRFHFTFIGDGPEKETLQKYVQTNDLPISILDAMPKNEIWNSLEGFDVLLFLLASSPIYKYGISLNKVADYSAAGRPIMMIGSASNNPISEADSGYIAVELKDLSILLVSMLTSVKEYANKGHHAREYAACNYKWSELAKKLDDKLK